MSDPTPTSSPRRTASVTFIFFTVVLDVLGFGLLIPVAPRLIQGLLNDGAGGTEAQAAPYFGLLTATYAAMAFVFAPVMGALSDRFGRRPVLLCALFGSALDYFAMALSPTLWFLFLTRAINGISGSTISVCNASIADVTTPDKRAAAFGILGAAFGLGFVLGPLMGGVLAAPSIQIPLLGWTYHGDIHYPFFAAGALTMINWAYGLFVLPESLPKEKRAKFALARANPIRVFAGVGEYPLVAGLAASLFLMNLAQFGLHTTWVLYTGHRYGWGPLGVGLSLAFVGVSAAVVQGGLARKIIPALGPGVVGEKRAIILGGAIAVLAYLGYGLATHGWMIFVIITLASLGGIAQPAFQALITRTVRADEQGSIQGAITGANSIAQIGGPLIAASVLTVFIAENPPFHLPGASFFVGAVLAMLGLAVAAWAMGRFLAIPRDLEPDRPREPGAPTLETSQPEEQPIT